MKRLIQVGVVFAIGLIIQAFWWQGTWVNQFPGTTQSTGPLQYDYSVLTYQCQTAREFFSAHGTLWGPDRWINGGYPLTFIWNSNVWLQSIAVAFPAWTLGTVLKFSYYLAVFALVLSWGGVLLNTHFKREKQCLTELFLLLFVGISLFRLGMGSLFLWAGMVTAGLFISACILMVGIFQKALNENRVDLWIHLAFAIAIGTWVHKTMLVMAGILFFSALVFGPNRKRVFLAGLGALVISVLLNWFWISPMLMAWDYKTLLPDAPFWVELPNRFLTDHFSGEKTYLTGTLSGLWGTTGLYLLSFMLGGFGAWKGFQSAETKALSLSWVILGVLCVFGGLEGFGSRTELGATLNHYRFLINWQFLGLFLFWTVRPKINFPILEKKVVKGFVFLGVLVCSLLPGYHNFFDLKPIVDGVPSQMPGFLKKVQSFTGSGGGVLIEDSGGWDRRGGGEKYFGTYLTGILPWVTHRHQLGGPYPYVFLKTSMLSPLDGKWLGKMVGPEHKTKLEKTLLENGIQKVIVWSPEMKSLFETSSCDLVGQESGFNFYDCGFSSKQLVTQSALLRLPGTLVGYGPKDRENFVGLVQYSLSEGPDFPRIRPSFYHDKFFEINF